MPVLVEMKQLAKARWNERPLVNNSERTNDPSEETALILAVAEVFETMEDTAAQQRRSTQVPGRARPQLFNRETRNKVS